MFPRLVLSCGYEERVRLTPEAIANIFLPLQHSAGTIAKTVLDAHKGRFKPGASDSG